MGAIVLILVVGLLSLQTYDQRTWLIGFIFIPINMPKLGQKDKDIN